MKMAKRKKSNYDEDYERIAENLFHAKGSNISDKSSFDDMYLAYMDGEEGDVVSTKFIDGVWGKYRNRYKDNLVHVDSGGKSLKRDRQQTARKVVDDVSDYKRLGADKVDLKGFDTKPRRKTFTFTGHIKTKIVKARKDTVINMGKSINVYRDRKGRFVSVKR